MNRTHPSEGFDDADHPDNILTFEEIEPGELDPDPPIGEAIFLPATDEFDEQVAKAQQQLEDLRRQQDEIERQKREIEELRVRQAQFQRGRVEMLENFQHALDVFDRETLEAEQRLEHYSRARESFAHHLDVIANLRPESWQRDDLRTELEHATAKIEEARRDYQRCLSHIDEIGAPPPALHLARGDGDAGDANTKPVADAHPTGEAHAPPQSFSYWLRSGLAFTLPLIGFGFFALMINLLFG